MNIVNPGNANGGSKLLTSVQTRTQGTYSSTYNATDGSGTDPSLTPLAITCTPASASSDLVLEWNIYGEGSTSGMGFIIEKDGSIISPSTDGTNGWSTTTVANYNGSATNYPEPTIVRFIDTSPVAGVSAVYTVHARITRTGSGSWYLNRCVGSAGASSYPTGISTATATEYYA
jgi:hypothetical protein